MTVIAAASLGIGSMIGAGIFALLGEAGAIAGSAVYLSFILAGIVALLSGYSLAKLGVRYPAAGGIVEYLVQSFGVGLFSGAIGIMLYISALVALALVAKTFGSYAVTFLNAGKDSHLWVNGFANGIIILFVLINLRGANSVARWEKPIVAIKVLILIGFAVVGLIFSQPELLSPALYPDAKMVMYSLAITFFAFEGFRVITNAAEDMPDPAQNTASRHNALYHSGYAVVYRGGAGRVWKPGCEPGHTGQGFCVGGSGQTRFWRHRLYDCSHCCAHFHRIIHQCQSLCGDQRHLSIS
jgi:amino acid transporter